MHQLFRCRRLRSQLNARCSSQLTAVGDTINTASRLEGIAKDLDAELVISEEVTRTAALAPPEYDLQSFAMRGRSAPVMAWIVKDTKFITHLVENSTVNV
jgi:class 3 adenylate cyclase